MIHPLLISKGNKPRRGVIKTCARCAGEYYCRPSVAAISKFCSRQCNNDTEIEKGTSKIIVCPKCGKRKKKPPSQIKIENFCSYKCLGESRKLKDVEKTTPRKKKSDRLPDKVWSVKYADIKFSKMIIARDKKCKRCGTTENLTCAHYWERHHSATRYHPDNSDALCWFKCHPLWEGRKNGAEEWKREQLGPERYLELERRHNQTESRSMAIVAFMYYHENKKTDADL